MKINKNLEIYWENSRKMQIISKIFLIFGRDCVKNKDYNMDRL